MDPINRFLPILALLLILSPAVSFAQIEEEARRVSLDLGFFNPFRPTPPPLFLKLEEETFAPVTFPRTMRGDKVHYEGPETLVFYIADQTPTGEPTYRPITEVLLREGLIEPLLIFSVTESTQGETMVQVFLMEMNPDHFPRGSLCVVNLSGITMQGIIGDQRATFSPGVNPPIAFAQDGVFRIGLAFEFNERVYPTFLNTVTLDPQTRQWMFVGKPRRPGSLRVQVRIVEDHTMLRRQSGP